MRSEAEIITLFRARQAQIDQRADLRARLKAEIRELEAEQRELAQEFNTLIEARGPSIIMVEKTAP